MKLAHIVLAGLYYHVGGFEHRYFIVDGPDTLAVGRYFWEHARATHQCVSVEVKRYPREHVVVHICNV